MGVLSVHQRKTVYLTRAGKRFRSKQGVEEESMCAIGINWEDSRGTTA